MDARTCFDVGCGEGAFAVRLCEKFPKLRVFGVDSCPLSIKSANHLSVQRKVDSRASFKEHNIDELDSFFITKFDSFISADSIQYSQDPVGTLRFLIQCWNRIGPFQVSGWWFANTKKGIEASRAWGIANPITIQHYQESISDWIGELILVDKQEQFRVCVEASLNTLIKLEFELRKLFGDKAYSDRLILERRTVDAVQKDEMGQVLINGSTN